MQASLCAPHCQGSSVRPLVPGPPGVDENALAFAIVVRQLLDSRPRAIRSEMTDPHALAFHLTMAVGFTAGGRRSNRGRRGRVAA